MKLGFEKLVEEHDIDVNDLPRNIQVAIGDLEDLKARVLAKTNIGQNISEATIERIRVKDQMIIRSILEIIDEDETNDDEFRNFSNNEEDITEEDNSDNFQGGGLEQSETAIAIDKELDSLHRSGVTQIALSDIKNRARTTFNLIWDSYDANMDNGIVTSNYQLIETEPNSETFELSKI
jgi:hypothetical protein